MSKPIVNFVVYTTEDFYRPVTLTGLDGLALNLTGVDLIMQVRESATKEVVFEASNDNGLIVVTSAAAGAIEFDFAAEDIENIVNDDYEQDLVAYQGDARAILWVGKFSTRGGITRF